MSTTDIKDWDMASGLSYSAFKRCVEFVFNQPREVVYESAEGGIQRSLHITVGVPEQPYSIIEFTPTRNQVIFRLKVLSGMFFYRKQYDLTGSMITITTDLALFNLDVNQQFQIYIDLESNKAVYEIKVSNSELLTTGDVGVLNSAVILGLRASLKKGDYYLATINGSETVPDFLRPRQVYFTTLPYMIDSAQVDQQKSSMMILVKTYGKGGSLDFTDTIVPEGQSSAVILTKERLLYDIMLPPIKEHFRDQKADFNYNGGLLLSSPFEFFLDRPLNMIEASVTATDKVQSYFRILDLHEMGGGVKFDVTVLVNFWFELLEKDGHQYIDPKSQVVATNIGWWFEWWAWFIVIFCGFAVLAISVIVISSLSLVFADIFKNILSSLLDSILLPIHWAGENFYRINNISITDGNLLITGEPLPANNQSLAIVRKAPCKNKK